MRTKLERASVNTILLGFFLLIFAFPELPMGVIIGTSAGLILIGVVGCIVSATIKRLKE